MITPNQLTFENFEEAWEGINEFMANKEPYVVYLGGGAYGNELVCYDNIICIKNNFFNPKFDFGKVLGYTYKKWSKLVNNYVNRDYLDLVKSEVQSRESKKASSYNYTFHFDNSHGSGKDCLISLSFCRRKKNSVPTVIYTTRASEVTSRLIFDFLLIQRLVEYVYGKGVEVEVVCYIPFMFVHVERFLMYMAYKGEDVLKIDNHKMNKFQQKLKEHYVKFRDTPLEKFTYKVHKRAALQVQKDEKGNPLAKVPSLLAKDLKLFDYPQLKNRKIRAKELKRLNKNLQK